MKRFGMATMALVTWMVMGAGAEAGDLVRLISWDEQHAQKKLIAGEYIDGAGAQVGTLRIAHLGPGPTTITILEIEDLGLDPAKTKYILLGRVRHEDVAGTAYLELWSHFADGQKFFTRTLATQGRLQSFSGTADWRDMEMPNVVGGSVRGQMPIKLVLNLVLPGKGTVFLGPLTLEQTTPPATWWDDSLGAWIGGIGGSVIGLMGALMGTLASLGRARALVFFLLATFIVLGAGSMVAGLVALFSKQPYAVWYPLILGGAITLPLGLFLWPTARKRFQAAELRRMQAMDVK